MPTQKTNLMTPIIIILIVIIGIIILIKTQNPKELPPLDQTNTELEQAVKTDTTAEINTSLDNITIEEIDTNEDLKVIDNELEKL